jgi:quercetin dioxygenase-like cupin family protein
LQRGRGGGIVGITVANEIVFHHGTTMVRRSHLAPGEAMPWHRDPFHRIAVVWSGDVLSIEHRDGGDPLTVQITAGEVEWEEPTERVHRAVNVGRQPYEQVTVFLLDRPDAVLQPSEGGSRHNLTTRTKNGSLNKHKAQAPIAAPGLFASEGTLNSHSS